MDNKTEGERMGTAMELTGKARVFAVFGSPIEHSRSPAMHNAAIQALGLEAVYVPFRVEPDHLPEAIAGVRAMRFAGVNLTIPLKEAAVGFVDELSHEARRIGAVNTLWWDGDVLVGHSTDGEGFLRSLEAAIGDIPHKALILGAGGSSRGVCHALADRGVKLTISNRTVEKAEKLASEISNASGNTKASAISASFEELSEAAAHATLVVNCTSVGMEPRINESPLPEQFLRSQHVIYDLVYNPRETLLLRNARAKGAVALNGVDMLVHQGALSFELWTGFKPPLDVMKQAVLDTL